MKRIAISLGAALVAGAMFAACSSSGGSTSRGAGGTGALGLANRALGQLAYSPAGAGYAYKATAVSAADANKIKTDFAPAINQALSQVGDGYVVQVTGHSCAIGPREAPGDGRPGNVTISRRRAEGVMRALASAGVPADKMTAVGVADDQPISGVDSKDQTQRRVTFQIVPKAN